MQLAMKVGKKSSCPEIKGKYPSNTSHSSMRSIDSSLFKTLELNDFLAQGNLDYLENVTDPHNFPPPELLPPLNWINWKSPLSIFG